MPLFRRFGRPGLLGLAARTAVVAGTASAVSGAVYQHQRRQAADSQMRDAFAQQEQQTAIDDAAREAVAAQTSTARAGGVDVVGELQKLASLHESGALSDSEFQAAKTRLLS